jgi:hypothetical protein
MLKQAKFKDILWIFYILNMVFLSVISVLFIDITILYGIYWSYTWIILIMYIIACLNILKFQYLFNIFSVYFQYAVFLLGYNVDDLFSDDDEEEEK